MVKGPRSTVSRLKHAETIFQASELAGSKSKNQEDCENLVHSRACRPTDQRIGEFGSDENSGNRFNRPLMGTKKFSNKDTTIIFTEFKIQKQSFFGTTGNPRKPAYASISLWKFIFV